MAPWQVQAPGASRLYSHEYFLRRIHTPIVLFFLFHLHPTTSNLLVVHNLGLFSNSFASAAEEHIDTSELYDNSPIVVHAQDAVLVRLNRPLALMRVNVPVTQQKAATRRDNFRSVGMKGEGNLHTTDEYE